MIDGCMDERVQIWSLALKVQFYHLDASNVAFNGL